ncbi:hypothetical protein K469DRAFT_563129 [Zopfia rhizophila CBS 207.26]|uniref:RNA ligase/cyclic nucleotide phosphodiesterase n=1 Tax=Zopfia rhizophila CBS 207.26 TaxID=1314779 RepID=A0A6A6EF08_9PEZI|nr:hypothetical protein K469DRAFT_563129 [Zopfia rhizophila CBS 207.26]
MVRFIFPALTAGPPSRRNWYKELLDHPDCAENSTRVREAYESHREAYSANQTKAFTSATTNPVTPDQALIKQLDRQKRLAVLPNGTSLPAEDDLDSQDVNCLVIWARPPPSVISLIQDLQQRIASLVGPDLHLIPSKDLHLSVIELSHRHSVPHLRSVADDIGTSRIQNILDLVLTFPQKPHLVSPQLGFDKMGIALNFLPLDSDRYTYHHLRSDMHALALESGVGIDMCYTAPSAHITLGRFIGNSFFDVEESREKFASRVQEINEELRKRFEPNQGGSDFEWAVAGDRSLELQLGYLKFGRERGKADMLGKI